MKGSLTLAVALAAGGAGITQAQACDYTVSGTLKVTPQLADVLAHYGSTSTALERVKVRVSENEQVLGIWMGWGNARETRTDGDGQFSITQSGHFCVPHRFRVEVMFENNDSSHALLEIWAGGQLTDLGDAGAPWYKVHEESSATLGSGGGSRNVGTLTFRSGGSQKLGNSDARKHAEMWLVYKDAIDHLAAQGSNFEFTGKVNAVYPNNSPFADDAVEASYADPIGQVIHIFRSADGTSDHFSASALLHEFMHVWAYQHGTGEGVLTEELLFDASHNTHDTREDSAVAFHEGFAEYAAHAMLEELYDVAPPLAFDRDALAAGVPSGFVLDTLDDVEHNDDGWTNMFRLLGATGDISGWLIGSAVGDRIDEYARVSMLLWNCSAPSVDFFDVLRSFSSGGSFGSAIDDSEMNVTDFLDRFASITSGFTSTDADHFRDFFDPASTEEPRDVYCTRALFP